MSCDQHWDDRRRGMRYANHLPTVLKGDGPYGVIECHLARANPHWKDLAEGNEALMIFQGPEGYITPNWYPSKAREGRADMELCGRPCLWPSRSYERQGLAAPPCERADCSAGEERS